jgi:alpha 1,3-glucosidase
VVDAVDRSKFKNCDQSSFCKRHRSLHEKKSALSYSITPSTFQLNGAELTAEIKESRSNTLYTLQLIRLEQNIVRLRINEKNPLTPRYEVKEAVLEKQIKQVPFRSFEADTNTLILDDSTKLVIEPTTVRLDLYVNNELSMSANSRSLFYFEYLRPRATPFVAPENEPVIAADAAGHIVVPADDQIQDDKVLGVTSETMHEKEGHPTEELLTTTDDPEYVKTQADELDMTGAWEEHFSTHKDDKLHGMCAILIN